VSPTHITVTNTGRAIKWYPVTAGYQIAFDLGKEDYHCDFWLLRWV